MTLHRWFPTTALGREASLVVRTMDEAHALVRFDNLSLPAGAHIVQATLDLYLVWRTADGPVTLAAYPVNRAWVEAEATWTRASASAPWASPGASGIPADRGATPLDTVTVSQWSGWVSLDVTEAARAWLSSPATNFGVLLRAEGQYPVELRFVSREWLGVQVRPRLRIRYEY